MATLDQYFTARDMIVKLYHEELNRDVINDPDALVNWIYHWREDGRNEQWIRERIKESVEWQSIHSIPNPSPIPDFPSMKNPTLIKKNVNPIGMAYWRNINNHRGKNIINVFLSINDELTIFTLGKSNLQVLNERRLGIRHTGEGCYFSVNDPNILFVPIGKELIKLNVVTGEREVAWKSNYNLWQCHSSYDERIHSATLKNDNWEVVGWGVSEGIKFDLEGNPDECQIDKSGKNLIIQESNNNRIIDLRTGLLKRFITDAEGALAHMDVGHEYMVGEDNFVGGLVHWDLNTFEKKILYGPNVWNMGYVSCQNNICLLSLPDGRLVLVNPKNGDTRFLANAPTQDQKYEHRVKANLCPLGEYAAWTAFVDGSLNAYIVKV